MKQEKKMKLPYNITIESLKDLPLNDN